MCQSSCSQIYSYNTFLSTVPIIESDNIVINEDAGSATVTVRLLNQIENNFVLSYRTAEFDSGANGKKMHGFIDATYGLHSERQNFKIRFKRERGHHHNIMTLRSGTWVASIFGGGGGGGGGEIDARGPTSPQIKPYYTPFMCVIYR